MTEEEIINAAEVEIARLKKNPEKKQKLICIHLLKVLINKYETLLKE